MKREATLTSRSRQGLQIGFHWAARAEDEDEVILKRCVGNDWEDSQREHFKGLLTGVLVELTGQLSIEEMLAGELPKMAYSSV